MSAPSNTHRWTTWGDPQTLRGHTDVVRCVAFKPDGTALVSGSSDHTIRLWRVADGELQRVPAQHKAPVDSVAFRPDGEVLACACGNEIQLSHVSNGVPLDTLKGHIDLVTSVRFSPDSEVLASGSADGTVRMWRSAAGWSSHAIRIPVGRARAAPSSLSWVVWQPYQQGQPPAVQSVAFSPDAKLLAASLFDGRVLVWQVADDQLLRVLKGHTSRVLSVAFSPDGTLLATGGGDHMVRLWHVCDGKLNNTLMGHPGMVTSVAFSPDGVALASGGADGTVRIWQVHDGQLLHTLDDAAPVQCVAFSPDGTVLACGRVDWTVQLWRAPVA